MNVIILIISLILIPSIACGLTTVSGSTQSSGSVTYGGGDLLDQVFALPGNSQDLVMKKVTRGISSEAPTSNPFTANIWQSIEESGRYWAKMYWNSSTTLGSARIMRATYSELYDSDIQTPGNVGVGQSANITAGAQSYAATTTIASDAGSGRTELSGTWANFSSGGQTPVVRYSLTAGASVQYTITGVNRIHWKAYTNTANGGVILVAVTQAGNPITAAQNLVGETSSKKTVRTSYVSSSFSDTNIMNIPLAKGLDSSLTYVVTLTLDSGSRIYDAGLVGYTGNADGYTYDSVGYHGIWDNYTSFYASTGNNYAANVYSGGRNVYVTPACTRIDWYYAKRVNGGFAGFKIYDSTGTEIDSSDYRNMTTHANGDRYINTYGASSSETFITVADDLPLGVYYVHIYSLPDQANSFTETSTGSYLSSKYAIYDGKIQTFNTSIGGNPLTDSFVDNNYQFTGGGSDPADSGGNYTFAGQVRDSGDVNINAEPTNVSYVTATHGAEGAITGLLVTCDGVDTSWSSAAVGDTWYCGEIVITFTTKAYTQTNPTTNYWADLTYTYTLNSSGIKTDFAMTTVRDIYKGVWYVNMMIAPNATATNGTLLGSGFTKLYLSRIGTIARNSSAGGTSTFYKAKQYGSVFYTPEGYGVATKALNRDDVYQYIPTSENATLATERLRVSKEYFIVFNDSTGGGTGTLLASGFTLSASNLLRFLYNPIIPTILD